FYSCSLLVLLLDFFVLRAPCSPLRPRHRRHAASRHQCIKTPASGPVEEDEEENKAIKNGQLAFVEKWKKLFRCRGRMVQRLARGVDHEIRDCHFTAGNEGSDAGEQAERDQKSTGQLDNGPDPA